VICDNDSCDAASLNVEPRGHGIDPQLKSTPYQRSDYNGREVVLGANCAGEAIARAATDAGTAAEAWLLVDGEGQTKRPMAEVTGSALDTPGHGRELARFLRVGNAARGLCRVYSCVTGHAEYLFGFPVVWLEVCVGPRPSRPGIARDLRILLEVLRPES